MKEAYDYLFEKLNADDWIVAAISGGPDSMALLHLLLEVNKNKNINIVCAHVNHNVRSESDLEQNELESFCAKHNVIFEHKKLNKIKKTNFHNQAHLERQNFFDVLVDKYKAKYLMTGHHSDDLIETILMRISRGSTLRGYAGFEKEATKKDYVVLRPLINLTKEQLENYCQENDIKYALDKSNESDKYTRNRYRKEIVPALKNENKKIGQKFQIFSDKLIKTDNFVDDYVSERYKKLYKEKGISMSSYRLEHPFVQEKLIYKLIQLKCEKDLNSFNDTHVELILRELVTGKHNVKVNLPKQYILTVQYGYINITKIKGIASYSYVLNDTFKLPNGKMIEFSEDEESNSNYVCRLSSSDIKLPLIVRSRSNGDTMTIMGLDGTKKISDIFTNEKISLNDRAEWPVVTDSDGKIVWLPGLKKSKFNKTRTEKYDIILKYH